LPPAPESGKLGGETSQIQNRKSSRRAMFDLPKMTDYEKTRAEFRIEIPDEFNFGFDVIGRRAAEADKTAFLFVDRAGETVTPYSFSDLDKASNRFANALLGLGAGKGDFAFVMIPRLPAWYEVMIGCIKTGIIAMPGTNLLTPKDIAYRVNKAGAKLAIVTAEQAAKVDAIRGQCPTLEHVIAIGGEPAGWMGYEGACAAASESLSRADVAPNRADDTMLAYFTSGTTAFPKMVPRDHGYALAHAITGRYWMDLEEDDVHWTLSDTGWAKAAWGMLFGPWMIGSAMVLYDGGAQFDADLHLRLIAKLGVTTFCAPPTVYRLFAQSDLSQYELGTLRHSIGAREPLNPEVIRVWLDATGTEVHDGYGQTETVNIVGNYPCVPIRPGSMGKPVPGIDVDIIDDDGNVLGVDEVGHIGVRVGEPYPPGLFHGYYDDDAANEGCFRGGATRDADGYIWFVGRSDDIISSASYRISPFEVESALQEHPAVAESAVVGKPDELRGEIVKAYVTLAPGFEASDALTKEIQDFVKAHTAPYKYPREIEFRKALPKTISGKIRRVDLRAEARGE
jgi:acetyl-CoA synthetase